MQYQDTKDFRKELSGLPLAIQVQIIAALDKIEQAETFADIPHLKAMKGSPQYYRIRAGNYRIGLYWTGNFFYLQRVGVRGNFYKKFP